MSSKLLTIYIIVNLLEFSLADPRKTREIEGDASVVHARLPGPYPIKRRGIFRFAASSFF